MQRIVDRSEATAERKRCPQMVAILIEIRQYVVTPQMYKRGFTCIMVSRKQTSNRDYRIQREVTTHE